MDQKTREALKQIGLTEGEIKVYLALIELGSSTVGPIIDKSQISSSKVYIILEKLIQKGLTAFITIEKTKYFQATQPISLLELAEKKEKEIQKTKKDLSLAIQKIQKIQLEKQDTEGAKIYKGYKGLKTGMLETAKSIKKGETYYFFSFEYGENLLLYQVFRDIASKLKSKKAKINGLANLKEKKMFSETYKKLGYEMRYTELFWPADISFSGKNLQILVWKEREPILYVLESEALVKSCTKFFNTMWKQARP